MRGKEVLENRSSFQFSNGTQIRIWRDEDISVDIDNLERDDIYDVFDSIESYFTLKETLELLKTIPRIVAIEITNSKGEGIVWYDWY